LDHRPECGDCRPLSRHARVENTESARAALLE
jgi:hypothetical protein